MMLLALAAALQQSTDTLAEQDQEGMCDGDSSHHHYHDDPRAESADWLRNFWHYADQRLFATV
jgi:hypothetical protein|eukprot:SAG25_NODE_1326_length_3285_cov_1.715945_5_plen_63_part_00